MVGIGELYTDVLSIRVDNRVAIVAKELARRRDTTISAFLNELICEAIDKELGLSTDYEIMEWARDFVTLIISLLLTA